MSTTANCQVRRATIDDLVALRRIWRQNNLNHSALEKALTEFQLVETVDGEILGALAVKLRGDHAFLHSEAYLKRELIPELRPRLWDRVQALARSQGLIYLWLENRDALYWLETGFETAGSQLLRKLPSDFGAAEQGRWIVRTLRDESPAGSTLEQELAIFRQFQQAEAARMQRQVRMFRFLAILIVLLVLTVVAWLGWYIIQHAQRSYGR